MVSKYLSSNALAEFIRRTGCPNMACAVGAIAMLKELDASGELEKATTPQIRRTLGDIFGRRRARDIIGAYRLFLVEDAREKALRRQRRYRQKAHSEPASEADSEPRESHE